MWIGGGGGVTDSLSMVTVLDTWSVHVDRGGGGGTDSLSMVRVLDTWSVHVDRGGGGGY